MPTEEENTPTTQVRFSADLDAEQYEKFTDFLAWLKKDREAKEIVEQAPSSF